MEKLPCDSPKSHDVTISNKLSHTEEKQRNGNTILKLGDTEEPLSVFKSSAFKGPLPKEMMNPDWKSTQLE